MGNIEPPMMAQYVRRTDGLKPSRYYKSTILQGLYTGIIIIIIIITVIIIIITVIVIITIPIKQTVQGLVGTHEGKRPLRISRSTWGIILKLTSGMERHGLDCSGSG